MFRKKRAYIAIDLKSFYASVECVERGLNPLTANLVVADTERSEKTICLAVSPSLKKYGIGGRARLFEVIQRVKEENEKRKYKIPNHVFKGESYISTEIEACPELSIAYIAAPPRMAYYIKYSTRIYQIYLKYIAPEDIHVYSIDEVFIDVTDYLNTYKMNVHDLAMAIIKDIFKNTGITATAGIGTNLYLSKIAMDIVAKHITPDENGVRIAELDELTYRKTLWTHRPLTDFWRVGKGYASKLEANGIYTMGDIAKCSVGKIDEYYNEDFLYKLFGINAELLIDHAWGWEPCTIADIKAYKPSSNSLSSGQVLHCPYSFDKAKLIVHEMTDLLVLDLVEKRLVTDQIMLTIGYDTENLSRNKLKSFSKNSVVIDHYGRKVPKPAHGSINLGKYTSSSKAIIKAVLELFDKITDKSLLIRRINVTANHVVNEQEYVKTEAYEQLDFLTDYEQLKKQREQEKADLKRERQAQEAIISIKKKFGRNAVLKGMNLEEGATTVNRNRQIGGHKA